MRQMTIGELRELINDEDIPDDTPLRILTSIEGKISTWEWILNGAYGQMVGNNKHLTLEIHGYNEEDIASESQDKEINHFNSRGQTLCGRKRGPLDALVSQRDMVTCEGCKIELEW